MQKTPILALIAFAASCAPELPAPAQQTKPAPEPDPVAAVVNAAADYFYVKDNGLDKDWSQGDFVVFDPEWSKKDDRTFKELVGAMMQGSDYTLLTVGKEQKPLVQRILDTSGDAPPSKPVEAPALKDMALDGRIVLDTAGGRGEYFSKVFVDRNGKKGKGRAVGSIMRPVFSNNMRYALVRMQIKWSVHSGPVILILEKKDKRWQVVYSDYTIWL